MRSGLSKILVTGGAGFIGSAFVRLLLNESSYPRSGLSLIVIDKLTYAGDLARLQEVQGKYKFCKADICNKKQIERIFSREKPGAVINFAAETHVDRSIVDARPFVETNVKGAQVLLDISKKFNIKKFIQISSDEVYGEIIKGRFSEDSPLKPNSPYAASKAAADLLIRSYIRTYDFPAVIIRPCNNYGPWQYPEKLIPLSILRVLRGEKIPLYAKGDNVREWLYVDDCAQGILNILKRGKIGETYNLGSNNEEKNIEVAKMILEIMKLPSGMIEFVRDRPGHDIRYSLNSNKLYNQVKWRPKVPFYAGLKNTINWYTNHKDWILNNKI